MQVQDVMSMNPVCCAAADSVQQAAILMDQYNVGIIPVIDSEANQKLVGVVTDRDLCLAVVAMNDISNSLPVGACMTTEPICCNADDPIEKAVALMQTNQLRRIPVVDDKYQIEGIVSLADVALVLDSPEELSETIKCISEPPMRPL